MNDSNNTFEGAGAQPGPQSSTPSADAANQPNQQGGSAQTGGQSHPYAQPGAGQSGQSGQSGQYGGYGQSDQFNQYNQYSQPNQANQPQGNPFPRFFAWVRSTGMVRTDSRWIGGVCGGIARRLGWDPALVRALVLVSVLLFGFGAALYAFGWVLMPDERDGRILAEELFSGRWDWSCVGAFVLLALAVFIPGPGWGALVLSALVLWVIAQGGVRQQRRYGTARPNNQPPAQPNNQSNARPNNRSNAQPNTQVPFMANSNVATQPGVAAMSYSVPQSIRPTVMAQPAAVRRARRKPAGSLVVLTVLGAIFLSVAVMSFAFGWSGDSAFDVVMPQVTIWISSICLILGVILLVLGAIGRRSGGLVPIAIIVVMVVCVMVSVADLYVYTSSDLNAVKDMGDYSTIELGASRKSENAGGLVALQGRDGDVDYWVSDSSPETFRRLRQGVYFRGDSYDKSVANIDLTQYARWDHTGDERNEYVNGCPAGRINLMVEQAQVTVTLPAGCPYSFGSSDAAMAASDVSSLGSRRSFVCNNDSYVVFDNAASDGEVTENRQYSGSFLINFVYGVSGKVRVRYPDSASLPSYSEFVDKQVGKDGWDNLDATTRKHYDIESGASAIAGEHADKTDTKEGEQ